jgi:hypothetical protein
MPLIFSGKPKAPGPHGEGIIVTEADPSLWSWQFNENNKVRQASMSTMKIKRRRTEETG